MNNTIISKEECEMIVFIFDEILRRDGCTVDDCSDDFKKLYFKLGGPSKPRATGQ
jgi:hypothetical protein